MCSNCRFEMKIKFYTRNCVNKYYTPYGNLYAKVDTELCWCLLILVWFLCLVCFARLILALCLPQLRLPLITLCSLFPYLFLLGIDIFSSSCALPSHPVLRRLFGGLTKENNFLGYFWKAETLGK